MKALQIILCAFLLLSGTLIAQQKKIESSFKKTACAVLTAFAKQDFKTLNKYVYNDNGVYIITRPGAIDNIRHCDSIRLSCFAFYPYRDRSYKKPALKYGEAPRFSCGDNAWTKKGFVADSATRYNRVSDLMDFLSKNQMGDYKIAEQEAVKKLEASTRKIVYTELAGKKGIVFYLTLVNRKWYLTFIDTVEGSCAA